MTKKYDFAVFIGRFEPPHIGHLEVIQHAAAIAKTVIILVGSAGQPRTIKNPWTYEERQEMIGASIDEELKLSSDVYIRPLHDMKYNDQKWAVNVQEHVRDIISRHHGEYFNREPNIAIIGHTKDESSYYLKMFPQWDLVEHDLNEQVNATDLRSILFEGKSLKYLRGVLPDNVFRVVTEFCTTPEYSQLVTEYNVIKKYKKAWEAAPYAPIFVTVDACVIQSGHILLVQRDAAPGEGLWAMPGGFLEQDEYIEDGVLRELKEETKIKVAPAALKGSIKRWRVFDRPDRSLRGRTITHAFLIELPAGPLPAVKGNDDARHAKWVKFADIREDQMFEDHWHIIQHFLGGI